MFGQLIKHPQSTGFYDSSHTRPSKRPRFDKDAIKSNDGPPPSRFRNRVVPDSEDDDDDDGDIEDGTGMSAVAARTDLESAMPPIMIDAQAIEKYEAFKASQNDDTTDGNGNGGRATGSRVNSVDGRLKDRNWVRGKSSIYVDAFNLALDTVLDEESHLFDAAERDVFEQWWALDYEAQYLYVRLFLRKTAAWHRVKKLGYHSDISCLDTAIRGLQRARNLPESSAVEEHYPGDTDSPGPRLGSVFTFADRSEDEINTLEEASSLLKLDELKALAKDARVKGKNKRELVKALRRNSQKQVGLGFVGLKRADTESSIRSSASHPDADTPEPESEPNPVEEKVSEANRDAHFTRKILSETGPYIRLSLAPLKLFERVHLIFYRSSEWTEKSLTTIILAKISRRNFPDFIVSRSANIFSSRSSLLEFEASLRVQFRIDSILEFNGKPTEEGFQTILAVFEEVYPRWRALLREEQEKEDTVYGSGEGTYLRRLSPAWVYTRIVHKTTSVLAKQKGYKREYELLSELLAQRLFHHSRRGAWYQRKALLEEHYMALLASNEMKDAEWQNKKWKKIALQTCEEGLQDTLVHIIYHYDLQKRIKKLEKALRISKRAQHDFTHVRLAAPAEVTFEGIRIEKAQPLSQCNGSPHPGPTKRGAKTVWIDPREGGDCSVEEMCLSHYRTQGWKGYHSEGGLLRTLFAYLFFDILFTYVPNVFQTPFQTCPLDLHTDAFFPSRISEINHRLIEISNGEGAAILRRIWDGHHERRTCVVGLDWSFELTDLLEITRCFKGEALATVCKVVAQEYGQRFGGVPDLFLWHEEKVEVMFAEVKSENDRLSDTQRLWIHVLSGAGVRVELCHAVAKEVRVVL
ncbi:VRR-NUC domain-domain-containing protein [Clohesyomyces aquaticus]|uniref:Fanconi-associated nuclease n=1 Tax=Clohesyomyces aquaticus TaxID=1231657 RepID=A0A1Y2ABU1_9PLEO|nr:VRR-NUC domain-domain-containing protein [Clohesyomyces aquaticus]